MNDVSNYDVTLWHFDAKIFAKFIGSIPLYFQAKFGRENVRANKVIVNKPKLG